MASRRRADGQGPPGRGASFKILHGGSRSRLRWGRPIPPAKPRLSAAGGSRKGPRAKTRGLSDANGEVRFAAITRPDGTARLERCDGEGKSRFEVATLADGAAALALRNPEEKRRFGVIAKANGFARLSTPLHRDAPSRGNKDRA
jgi:hypothetical protein